MSEQILIKAEKITDNGKLPERAHDADAGWDLFSPIERVIAIGEDILIPLDIRLEIPKGYVGIIKEKSGMSTRTKSTIGACVIDAGYSGNCHVHLINHGSNLFTIKKGQKIAQIIFLKLPNIKIIEDKVQTNSERGEGGFGSTGI